MEKKTMTEFEIEVSGGRITKAQVMPDGSCKIIVELETTVPWTVDTFVKVEASTLSLNDEFMKHEPKTKNERVFKEQVKNAIKSGLNDFYRPKYDPSFNEDCTSICYALGKKPAVGKSYNWWEKVAKEFNPERKSRLGTKTEYIAFLAVLIKELIASGKSVEWAWNAVCNDSKELGHYWNSKGAKHDFETTGSRDVCGWCDLANTCKILAEDKESGGFWLAGGYCFDGSLSNPLAFLWLNFSRNDGFNFSCGWIVLER